MIKNTQYKQKAGLYIHIPFCAGKCPYCDFFSSKYEKSLAREYINALSLEMDKYNGEFDTVYLGGGTPSILESDMIGEILSLAREKFTISDNAEITIECNPSKNLEKDFYDYASFGINRVSIGMQSANDEERIALGRRAGRIEVEKAINDAKHAGINNISLDVMLGIEKQTLSSLDYTFDFIGKMNVNHISAYMLKIEENTYFGKIADKLNLPDDDMVSEMYLKTIDSLALLGFNQYEISNFAKTGYESRHNLKYWTLADYLGIGKTAHSLWQGKRFYYDKNFVKIDDGNADYKTEKIMLGLRLNKGIEKSLLDKDYTKFLKLGLLEEKGENIALTKKGMLVSNVIIGELL